MPKCFPSTFGEGFLLCGDHGPIRPIGQRVDEAIHDRLAQRISIGVGTLVIQALRRLNKAHALMRDNLMGAVHRPMLDGMGGFIGTALFAQSSLANH